MSDAQDSHRVPAYADSNDACPDLFNDYARACVPWVIAAPARSAAATVTTSAISC